MHTDQRRSTPTNYRQVAQSLLLSCVVSVAAPFCGSVRAQDIDPNSLFGRDSVQSVFVRDSAVAVEKFALAGRMEHLKEWDKAGDVYQDILKSYADRVVPSQVNKDNKIYQYTSVVPAVQERLAKWPQEGLDVYRGRYEGEAAAVLENAHDDLGQLHRVFSLYFITDSARTASLRLMDLYLERGEFAASAWLGDRLLNWHPALKTDEPKILYRTALAHQLSGNIEGAQTRLAALREKFPLANATIRGGDVVLAESLTQMLGASENKLRETSPDSWPIAFGSQDRARVPQVNSFGGARLFGIELPKGANRTLRADQRKILEDNARDIANGVMTGIFPVVDHGELFFQDNARVYGVSLESGMPLPGWAETYDGERGGRYTLPNALPFARSQQCTVTVTEDSVLAIMGAPDVVAMRVLGGYGIRDTKLVCLDRRTGAQKWVMGSKQLPEEPANLRTLDLSGSPLVVGDTVYLQARGGKGVQFEDSYVIALEVATGKFKWACYIASANSTATYMDTGNLGAVFGQNVSHLAYSSGRLYALTNLGAVAAVDAYDGTVVWLDLYNRQQQDYINPFRLRNIGRVMQTTTANPSVKPWTSNPVMVSQGKVFVLPSDASDLYIYDASTGKEFKRIPMRYFDNADTVLGIVDEKLILNNDRRVYCINWRTFDESENDREKFLFWLSTFQRTGSSDDSIRGRGLVTADSVIIPTAWQLFRLSLNGGKIVDSYPPGNTTAWGEDEGPGNVMMTQDRLILAGPTASGTMRVNAYTDLTLAMRKLDADVAAAPNDPAPRLRYAEVLFVAGKIDLAIGRLDEAIAMIAGKTTGASVSGTTRERVFTTTLTFAEKLAKEKREGMLPFVAGLYDRAALAASTPSQQVHYRLSRAGVAAQTTQPEQEIKFYQQILLDPQLRAVSVSNAEGDDIAGAGEIARQAIAQVLMRTARSLYAPYEAAAVELLNSAKQAGDPKKLQELAMMYPNALAAPQALLAAADIYEAGNNPRGATQALRIAYIRYPDDPEAPRVLETMARNYLRMPGRVDVAVARLKQAGFGRMLSKPLVFPDGSIVQNVSLGDAAAQLERFSSNSMLPELPDPRLATSSATTGRIPDAFLPEQPQSIVRNIAALVVPAPQFAKHDRVVTFTDGVGIRVFPVGSTEPSASSDALANAPRGAAWIGENLLVWSQYEVAMIGPGSAVSWKAALRTLPPLDIVAQSTGRERTTKPVEVAAEPVQVQGQVILNVNGQVVNINAAQGQRIIRFANGGVQILGAQQAVPVEQARPAIEEIDKLRLLSDRIVFSTTDGRLMSMSLDAGTVLWQTRINDRMPLQLLSNDDFVVSHIKDNNGVSSQITVLDTFTGQTLFRQNFGSPENISIPSTPVNLALSNDGMLVYLLPNRIEGRDLFSIESRDKPSYSLPVTGGDMNMPFANSDQPDHLQIAGDRIFVVGSSSTGSTVWMRDLHTGAPIKFNQSEQLTRLDGSSAQGKVMLRTTGSMVYVATSSVQLGFDISRETGKGGGPDPDNIWKAYFKEGTTLRDLIPTAGHLITINAQPGAPADGAAARLQLNAFSRAVIKSTADGRAILKESGLHEHDPALSVSGAPIRSYQVVQGGVYYLSDNNELHFRKGAKAP